MRRGRKEALKDAEVLHVCIHEGTVGLIQQILWEKQLQRNFMFLGPSFPPSPLIINHPPEEIEAVLHPSTRLQFFAS